MRKLYGKIRSLKDAPYMGRPGLISRERENFCSAHALYRRYRVHRQIVEVWRIYHSSQNPVRS